jgi:metal-responsive CopG/Arc/MetJ family transcriptional regulator
MVVETVNNGNTVMATMSFSVPNDVKERFNRAFAGANKSAIVTALLQEAVERAERKAKRNEAIGRVLSRMDERPILSQAEIDGAREDGRP